MERMIKKSFVIILSIIGFIGFTSCSSESDDDFFEDEVSVGEENVLELVSGYSDLYASLLNDLKSATN